MYRKLLGSSLGRTLLGVAVTMVARVWADPARISGQEPAHTLTLEQSIRWALQNNPELTVFRAQRGIAAAGIVIGRTYPFNPVLTAQVLGDNGPASAGITNHVFNQNQYMQEIECRGQARIRRELASATLSRVEWEIAAQEQQLAVRAIRAFYGYIYQHEKLHLLDETIRLQEETVDKVKRLVDQGKLRTADLMLARSDAMETRAQRGPRQSQAILAWHDLRRVLGVQKEMVRVHGQLPTRMPEGVPDQWAKIALQTRPELRAVQIAYVEAEHREQLEIANRFGNPMIGAKSEYNETQVTFVGAVVQFSLPWHNTRRGEILQRQAEKTRVLMDRKRLEIQINQDVLAAMDRLRQAGKWVDSFDEILPALRTMMDAFDRLFTQGEPGVDVLRLIDVRRRYLRSRDSYLDALWELNQGRADLAAAVGDFILATIPPCPQPRLGPPETPVTAPASR